MQMLRVEHLNPSTSFPYPMNRKEEIERALTTPSRRMALSVADDLQILCCGASAFCVLGLLSRSTMDVIMEITQGIPGTTHLSRGEFRFSRFLRLDKGTERIRVLNRKCRQ